MKGRRTVSRTFKETENEEGNEERHEADEVPERNPETHLRLRFHLAFLDLTVNNQKPTKSHSQSTSANMAHKRDE